MSTPVEDPAEVSAIAAGDEGAFASLTGRYRRELHVHCYRMLGSFEEAEDAVQETLLRAWRRRDTFEGRSTYRAWLYRIATNSALEILRRRPRPRSTGDSETRPPIAATPWLQPYPDALLNLAGDPDHEPEVVAVARETVELAYLAAVQHLSPKQRAVLILRDVLHFSARETADVLDDTVAAVNSALQRARAAMRALQEQPPVPRAPDAVEEALLRRMIEAHERADPNAIVALLHDDVHMTLCRFEAHWAGRAEVGQQFIEHMMDLGEFRGVATRANGQPAIAWYLRAHDTTEWMAFSITVIGIRDGHYSELTTFTDPALFAAFGLAPRL